MLLPTFLLSSAYSMLGALLSSLSPPGAAAGRRCGKGSLRRWVSSGTPGWSSLCSTAPSSCDPCSTTTPPYAGATPKFRVDDPAALEGRRLDDAVEILRKLRRPPTVNGGGFVVTDQDQRAVFSVDGCGIIGASGQLIVRDGDGNAILFIHKKGGIVQALSVSNWWRGYLTDYGEPSKLVFSLQDPKPVLCMKGDVQVTLEPKGRNRHWDYEVTGSFVQRSCAIKNRAGHVAAQIGVKGMLAGRDFYQVVVQPGYDQAFVVGVIAILDNIHGESTRC
ncbi:protein LURP-one-related 6 [Setaria italica]|uniref:protein LURP-one-related 6 n=1 Tax=Setaria italica TaxID=4555 RepID=UPI000350EE6A|nr:protein LURP-one-related 6 [Setaria italica]